ncbi:hypothetical protein D1BOALGB6SA_472 [Olavius sp. associated proteobacterium Delta 1]|nr:hypothetical protein D1BOALGB6SA_472 [Olavius sp. associated proteobacterium Delta 1]
MNFNDIQDPETRIQDQSILSMVFIAAAELDFKILCNYRVYANPSRTVLPTTALPPKSPVPPKRIGYRPLPPSWTQIIT